MSLVVDVTLTRGGFTLEASFEAGPGVTALFGPSGAGKSTLLAAVAGAIAPARGRITLDGQVWADGRTRLPTRRRRVGWAFQDGRLFPHLSVRDNLLYGYRRAPAGERPIALQEAVVALGVEGLLDRRPASLSGGERMRAGLARALLAQPRLLLLDEPLAGVDAPQRAAILPFVARATRAFGVPALYVTHSLAEVIALADAVVWVGGGQARGARPLDAALADPASPFARRADAGVLLAGRVAEIDVARGLARVRTADGAVLSLPAGGLRLGEPARLFLLARDVILAAEPPGAISVRNILPAVVEDLTPRPDGVLARVRAGGATLLALVTADAAAALALAPGRAVHALIKASSVERGGGPGLLDALD